MASVGSNRAHATFRDVEKYKLSDVPTSDSIGIGHSTEPRWSAVLWGPVLSQDAQAAGCVTASLSILVKPADTQGFAAAEQAALACIHPDIYPRPCDTPKPLAARLSRCTFLDEIKAKWSLRIDGALRSLRRLSNDNVP